jgi:hypothetical protein
VFAVRVRGSVGEARRAVPLAFYEQSGNCSGSEVRLWEAARFDVVAAEVPSSKVTCKSPRTPVDKLQNHAVSMTLSMTALPTEFRTAIDILSLCTSIPIYLVLVIKGVLFWRLNWRVARLSDLSLLLDESMHKILDRLSRERKESDDQQQTAQQL